MRRALLAWYDENRRTLPWRAEPGQAADPYAVLVSEIMLQQTRVETVRSYFDRWMERFPTLDRLANAAEDDVLKMWEGLGYYSRARNLHRTAREVAREYGGQIPRHIDGLRALPGIGRYTAGAIASIAFGREAPIVDGNVRRVFARWLDLEKPSEAELWSLAESLVKGDRPGDLNQAVMELGATVCTPRGAQCAACPVTDYCAALAAGTVERRPAPRVRRSVPTEEHGVLVTVREHSVLLVRRPEGKLLGGLWEFPGKRREPGETLAEAATRAGASYLAEVVGNHRPLCRVSHAFTHLRIVYHAFLAVDVTPPPALESEGHEPEKAAWVSIDRIREFALPRAQQRIAEALRKARLFEPEQNPGTA